MREDLLFRVLAGPGSPGGSGSTVVGVELQHDVRDFLASRRARLTQEQVGLPVSGGYRRVKGLRREEVALLAGVSVDYYSRLERGHLAGASEDVLDAVARALRLDDAEHQHLLDLARNTVPPRPRRTRRAKPTSGPRDAVMSILHGMSGIPAYVRTPRMDILAANDLCRALYGGALDEDKLPLNVARYLFLDPHSRGFFTDWDLVADDTVGALRMQAGRDVRDRALSDLIGELSTRSDEFVTRWARQNVRLHRTTRKRLHNRVIGDIELTGNALELPGDGLVLIAYTADPGSPAEEQLQLLATWAATQASGTVDVTD
ncbi:helix-turn-helix domain-containing protein [Actinopolymorpha cephalotaxi]|uniref:Transcriptional regulator with XRE-family HTH domain n=1 Tax=Actinopolymorpha cephalotaxi TaxID=504797 RepID=A0ABX2S496_9ACTN|nr:transcriptional regulator with XRE-family HTH domain [Actinopolymorpha cephalotaxi]